MSRPRLLDLFCGAGGAAKGYQRAGFYVVGVDIKPQPHYCGDEFYQADAMEYPIPRRWSHGFDAVHASPPCQFATIARNNGSCKGAIDLLTPTLRRFRETCAVPWIIENVVGAPLPSAVTLCGASFGLRTGKFDLNRHRLFETSFGLLAPPCQHKRGQTIGVYGNGTNSYHRAKFGRCVTIAEMREAMGIDWMTRTELSQAIPPAYTEYIGRELLNVLGRISPQPPQTP